MRITIFFIAMIFCLVNCGTIYIPQILPEARGVGKSVGQDNIEVKVVAITEKSLLDSNLDPYVRRVVDASDLTKPAKLVSVNEAIGQKLPTNDDAGIYRLGVGDELTILQKQDLQTEIELSNEQRQSLNTSATNGNIAERVISIADDGFVSILGIGRVQLEGLTQFEAEDLLYRELVLNENSPEFELKISNFKSKGC